MNDGDLWDRVAAELRATGFYQIHVIDDRGPDAYDDGYWDAVEKRDAALRAAVRKPSPG